MSDHIRHDSTTDSRSAELRRMLEALRREISENLQ